MNGTHVDDLLPAYALDALDEREQQRVSVHIQACPRCRSIADSDRSVVEQIGFAAPRHLPPPDLKARVLERVAAVPAQEQRSVLPSAVGDAAPRPLRPARPAVQSRRSWPAWLLAAAAFPWLLVLILGVALARSHADRTVPVLATPLLHGPQGEYGRLAMDPGGTSAFLMLTHMPALPAHRVYICWLERNGRMESVATFRLLPHTDDATIVLHAPRHMGDYTKVGVTMESSPRASRPTGTLLALGILR